MGSDIQYSTEMLYPSVSFYSSMGEVTRKPTGLLQRKVEKRGRTGKGRGKARTRQVNSKQPERNSLYEAEEWRPVFLQKSPSPLTCHQGLTENLSCARSVLGSGSSRELGDA